MKVSGISLLASAILGVAALAAAAPAHADVVLQTASFSGTDNGDYQLNSSDFIGARFSVSGETEITSIDVGLGEFGNGTIFAAIVPLSSASALPSVDPTSLASIALDSVLIDVPQGINEVSTALSFDLAAGNYAVVFGSGLFGASGDGPLDDSNTRLSNPIGGSSLFQSDFKGGWDNISDRHVLIEVDGTSVPEPSSLALLAAGCLLATAAVRRNRRAG